MKKYFIMIEDIKNNSEFVGEVCYSKHIIGKFYQVVFPNKEPHMKFIILREYLKEITKEEYIKYLWSIDNDEKIL